MRKVYYNEFDPFAAEWLKKLISYGYLPNGDVDSRSIKDVRATDLVGYTQLHFFSGVGGWPLALEQAGWGDRPVFSGSCPCQSFSSAGKQKGFDDDRHLWPVFYELIRECKPEFIFGEQVASNLVIGKTRSLQDFHKERQQQVQRVIEKIEGEAGEEGERAWIDDVQLDLENSGYTFGACVIPACSLGAPHIRKRLFWVASLQSGGGDAAIGLADTNGQRQTRQSVLLREKEAGRIKAEVLEVAGGSSIDGLAIASNDRTGSDNIEAGGWGRESLDAGTEGIRQTQWSIGSSGTDSRVSGSINWLGDTTIKGLEGHNGDGNGSGEPRWNETDSTGHAATASIIDGLADTTSIGLEEQVVQFRLGTEQLQNRNLPDVCNVREGFPARHPGPTNGFWRDADWLRCRDSKWRPVMPNSSALAHGTSDGVGSSRPRNRSQRLKGYGNAIAVPVAVEFIKAFMEIEG